MTLSPFLGQWVGADVVALGAAGHGHVQAFAGSVVVGQGDTDRHGLPFDGLVGQRVAEVAAGGGVVPAESER